MTAEKSESKSENQSLSNPHDRLFKKIFSRNKIAKYYLEKNLNPKIIQKLDLNSLRLDNNSYVDEELQTYFADVVYDCKYGSDSEVNLVFLFEHKSYIPKYPHIQLLKYMIRIWEHRIAGDLDLQPIIPIILYHGATRWKYQAFDDYFAPDQIDDILKEYVPRFNYMISDLSQFDSAEIKQTYQLTSLRIALLAMKHFTDSAINHKLLDILDGAGELLENEADKEVLKSIIVYLYSITKLKNQRIEEVMKELKIQDVALPGSTAWELRNEGKEEGKRESQIEVAKNSIQEGFDNEVIAKITGLSIEAIEELRKELN